MKTKILRNYGNPINFKISIHHFNSLLNVWNRNIWDDLEDANLVHKELNYLPYIIPITRKSMNHLIVIKHLLESLLFTITYVQRLRTHANNPSSTTTVLSRSEQQQHDR